MRYLVRVNYSRLKEKQREAFLNLFQNGRLKPYIYKAYENDLIIHIALFDRLQYEFDFNRDLRGLLFTLLLLDEQKGQVERVSLRQDDDGQPVVTEHFSSRSEDYDAMVRRLRFNTVAV